MVCAGSDRIHGTWGPYGNADMLELAMFVGQRYDLRQDDELALALVWSPQGVHGCRDWRATRWTKGVVAIWCWLHVCTLLRLHGARSASWPLRPPSWWRLAR